MGPVRSTSGEVISVLRCPVVDSFPVVGILLVVSVVVDKSESFEVSSIKQTQG